MEGTEKTTCIETEIDDQSVDWLDLGQLVHRLRKIVRRVSFPAPAVDVADTRPLNHSSSHEVAAEEPRRRYSRNVHLLRAETPEECARHQIRWHVQDVTRSAFRDVDGVKKVPIEAR